MATAIETVKMSEVEVGDKPVLAGYPVIRIQKFGGVSPTIKLFLSTHGFLEGAAHTPIRVERDVPDPVNNNETPDPGKVICEHCNEPVSKKSLKRHVQRKHPEVT